MHARRAFTYVELMIVLTIIAILAAIAVPNFLEAQTRAAVARSKADQVSLKMAIETFRVDHRSYPLNQTPGEPHPHDLLVLTTPIPYMTRLPEDFLSTQYARPRSSTPLPPPTRYRYINGLQIDSEEGLSMAAPVDRRMEGFLAGLLWGMGPDGSIHPEKRQSHTQISPDGLTNVLLYDPTNGTTSGGDIHTRIP